MVLSLQLRRTYSLTAIMAASCTNLHCFIVASNALWYLWFGDSHSLFKQEYGEHDTIVSASLETTAPVCY